MNKTPYKNKSNYDPGRFRSTVEFLKQVALPDGSGGTDLTYVLTHTGKAIELPVKDGNQLEITAGASSMNEDRWFVIRASAAFLPTKDMNLKRGNDWYILRAIVPVDEPLKYYKLLCIRQHG